MPGQFWKDTTDYTRHSLNGNQRLSWLAGSVGVGRNGHTWPQPTEVVSSIMACWLQCGRPVLQRNEWKWSICWIILMRNWKTQEPLPVPHCPRIISRLPWEVGIILMCVRYTQWQRYEILRYKYSENVNLLHVGYNIKNTSISHLPCKKSWSYILPYQVSVPTQM